MPTRPSPMPDPYQVLGVSREATPSESAAAYRALVRQLHPDAQHEPDPARLTEVLAAYAELRDPRRRVSYDSHHPAAPSPNREPTSIPVRVHRRDGRNQPDIRFGPVRHPTDGPKELPAEKLRSTDKALAAEPSTPLARFLLKEPLRTRGRTSAFAHSFSLLLPEFSRLVHQV